MKANEHDIPGYPGYTATKSGKVFSYKKKRKELKIHINNAGYKFVGLYCNRTKKTKSFPVHRILAMIFIGDITGMQINHKNGNKLDNRINNLEICTASENILHSFKMGMSTINKGSECNLSKLREHQIKTIKKRILAGHKNKKIAKDYNVDPSLISHIKRGKAWAHL